MRALPDRWVIAIGGSAVMLLIGTVYSWAIFAQPLIVGFGWDLTTTTWAYAIANFCLATVGVVVGGLWLDRREPSARCDDGRGPLGSQGKRARRARHALFGAPWLYITYGLIGGVGAGMAYVTPLAVVSKWFPRAARPRRRTPRRQLRARRLHLQPVHPAPPGLSYFLGSRGADPCVWRCGSNTPKRRVAPARTG